MICSYQRTRSSSEDLDSKSRMGLFNFILHLQENTVMRVLDDSKCRKANIVVRAEIGIDDVVKKWKLMAEKHNRKLGRSSGTQASKDAREEKGN
jgi:hypothetical protein